MPAPNACRKRSGSTVPTRSRIAESIARSRSRRDGLGAEHAGEAPCRQQAAVDAADVARAEHVGEIRGNRREPAAVHREDDHRRGIEIDEPNDRRLHADLMRDPRNRQVQHDAEREEDPVRVAPADVVRRAGPDEAADHVEQADHHDVGRREAAVDDRRQRRAEDLGHHRLRDAEHADAGRDVEAEHDPELIELRRLQRFVDVHVVRADHALARDAPRRAASSPRASSPAPAGDTRTRPRASRRSR